MAVAPSPPPCPEEDYTAQYIAIPFLVVGSGLFSGLIIGLMTLSEEELEELCRSSDAATAWNAKMVLPLRKLDNWLLCTVLLVNVYINVFLAVKIDEAFENRWPLPLLIAVPTLAVFIFGEVIPQGVMSKYGLAFGARLTWLVWPLMYLLAPVCWPIGRALDLALQQPDDEQPDDKQLSAIMRPWSSCHTVGEDAILDESTLATIQKSGQDEVPVTRSGDKSHVVAILYTRDLLGVHAETQMKLSDLLAKHSA